jgi:HD-like signal output (HDOD) protein
MAAELSAGRMDLPSFPDIAVRVRRLLADQNFSLDQLVRVVGSEPALAARLLRIANSATFNTSGKAVTDVRAAITRLGFDIVRIASMSFAMAQIRNNGKLKCVKHYLDELWERSVLVAALAFVLARTCTKINPDEAMLTGMMHGIGQLYVITRAADHPGLYGSEGTLRHMVKDWSAAIGKAILENWEFADEVVQAVADQHDLAREGVEAADLSDIVAIAVLMAANSSDRAGPQHELQGLPAVRRLGLNEAKLLAITLEFDAEVGALREALG